MGSFTNVDGQLHIFSDVVRSFSLTGQPAGGGRDRLPAGRPVMLTDTADSWKSEKVHRLYKRPSIRSDCCE